MYLRTPSTARGWAARLSLVAGERQGCQAVLSDLADCAIQKFDDVQDFLSGCVPLYTGTKLEYTSGIRRCNDLCFRCLCMLHFFLQQFERRFCLCDVVDTG